MTDLEEKLSKAYTAQSIAHDKQKSIQSFLDLLANKDYATYEHSIRVGLLASEIGEYLHLDSKALLYAGLFHDTGKALVKPETLRKTEKFDENDYAEIKLHSEYGFRLVHPIHNFTAHVIARVHRYQDNGYPAELPDYDRAYSEATRVTIDYYAMITALADNYDAASTRVNEKHGEKRKLTKSEVKAVMLEKLPHFKKLIDELYRNGIFEDEILPPTPIQQEIENMTNIMPTYRLPREIRRDVQLALALEPLAEKPGCTTRSRDCSKYLKLEYFISGAVNVGDAFEDMAIRILDRKTQPLIYDLAYQAQLNSKRNRGGGRINEGMIEMLTPIITAQLIYDKDRKLDVDKVLGHTHEVILNTSRKDVEYLVALKRLSYDMCAYHDRQVTDHNAQTVAEFYGKELETAARPVSVLHNREIIEGFPVVNRIYRLLAAQPGQDLSERVREAYLSIKAKEHAALTEGGLTADCCGVALYLLFSHHPQDIIVR